MTFDFTPLPSASPAAGPRSSRAPRVAGVPSVVRTGAQLALLGAVLSLVAVPTAQAQRGRRRAAAPEVVEAPGEASRRAAQAAFAAGELAEAERLYEQAFAESANPVTLVGLADARERQGDAAGAVEALERYLALRTEAPDRGAVEARVAALRAQPGVVLVTAEPPGEVWLDGERTGYVTPVELTLPPGEHAVAVTVRGEILGDHAVTIPFGGRTTLSLVEGQAQASDAAADPEATGQAVDDPEVVSGADPAGVPEPPEGTQPSPVATEPSADEAASLEGDGVPLPAPAAAASEEAASRYQPRRAAAITAGVAAGTLVVGTVLGFMALTEQSDFDDAPSLRAANRGERLALFSDVMFGVAGIAAVTSIVLYVTDKRAAARAEEATASRLRLTPLAGRRGAGFAATLQF